MPGPPVPKPAAPWPPSAYVLIAVNAVPVVGVLLFHWTVFSVILLYWCENVIVGVFNVLRMLTAEPGDVGVWIGKGFIIPFFCVHYGMFTFVHGELVLALFGGGAGRGGLRFGALIDAVGRAGVWYGVVFMALSHLVSFVHNYLLGGEYRRTGLNQLMTQPYSRVMVLHFTILLGGVLVQLAGSPIAALPLLVVLKTALDLRAHLAERARLAPAPAV